MAIDTLLGLWTPFSSIVLILFSILVILIGDAFAEKFITIDSRFMHHDHTTFYNGLESKHPHPIISAIGSSFRNSNRFFQESSLNVLPNFWIWYEGKSIRDAMKVQMDSHMEFLILTIYNAALSTPVVGFTVLTMTMMLAVRAFGIHQKLPRRYLSPVLCFFAFVFDLLEDLALVLIIVGYPNTLFPVLEDVCAWCSFLKYVTWFVLFIWNLIMALKTMSTGGKAEHLNVE